MLADREREILDLWRVCQADLEGLTKRTAGDMLRSIKFRVIDRIIDSAGKNNRLSGYDDELFTSAKQLREIYLRAVRYYELHSAELNTFSIKSLVLGIYETLRGRLQIFQAQMNGGGESSIAIERIKLLSAGVTYFMLSFKNCEQAYKNTWLSALELAGQFTPEFFETYIGRIQNDILQYFIENNYPAYKKAVQVCVTSLNNLRERKTLFNFYTLLSDEYAVLLDVSRQASEVEQELARNACNSLEFDIVTNFLAMVNEARLFYNSDVRKLTAFFLETPDTPVPEPESADSLYIVCCDMLANTRLIAKKDYLETASRYKSDRQAVNDWAEVNAGVFTARIESQPDLSVLRDEREQRSNGLISQAKETAETIACVFARQVSFYRENADSFTALAENDIIGGINETLIIKTEVLKESISFFEVNQYSVNAADLLCTAEECEQLLKELPSIWRAEIFSETADDKIMDALYNCAVHTGAAAAYRKRITDLYQREAERVDKAVRRFLKDSVLFEISTFEEIMQYSVTRLRESEFDSVKDYIDMIDENARTIEDTLRKTGITMIRPNPHDTFNGKEHEILMAEQCEGFAKGEIIKYMTSGYRLNGQVLIRANIIAAR